jgi:sterol desaturase/sphingolipid hydroxylase (fatty acid hydroxylase superfamily)
MFSKNETWNRQGLFNYLITNLLMLFVLICFFILGMIKIKCKKNVKVWNIVFYIFFLLMFVALFYGYYHWATTGFDH